MGGGTHYLITSANCCYASLDDCSPVWWKKRVFFDYFDDNASLHYFTLHASRALSDDIVSWIITAQKRWGWRRQLLISILSLSPSYAPIFFFHFDTFHFLWHYWWFIASLISFHYFCWFQLTAKRAFTRFQCLFRLMLCTGFCFQSQYTFESMLDIIADLAVIGFTLPIYFIAVAPHDFSISSYWFYLTGAYFIFFMLTMFYFLKYIWLYIRLKIGYFQL